MEEGHHHQDELQLPITTPSVGRTSAVSKRQMKNSDDGSGGGLAVDNEDGGGEDGGHFSSSEPAAYQAQNLLLRHHRQETKRTRPPSVDPLLSQQDRQQHLPVTVDDDASLAKESRGGASIRMKKKKASPSSSSSRSSSSSFNISCFCFHFPLQHKFWSKLSEINTRVPARCKMICLITWMLWKLVSTIVILYFVGSSLNQHSSTTSIILGDSDGNTTDPGKLLLVQQERLRQHLMSGTLTRKRVLYVVTSFEAERLPSATTQLLRRNIESMIDHPYHFVVDVYLILGYSLSSAKERRRLYQQIMPDLARPETPSTVGLQLWDDAAPLGYTAVGYNNNENATTTLSTRGVLLTNSSTTTLISRQHRYVVKDKLMEYDVFCAFDDRTRVTGHHVDHFLQLTHQLEEIPLKMLRSSVFTSATEGTVVGSSKHVLDRFIPGFVRVEVRDSPRTAEKQSTQRQQQRQKRQFDPRYCCSIINSTHLHQSSFFVADDIGSANNLQLERIHPTTFAAAVGSGTNSSYFSDTALDWLAILPPNQLHTRAVTAPRQRRGWILTPEQILRLERNSEGGFLPPFDPPFHCANGLLNCDKNDFLSLYDDIRGDMKQFISLHPRHFSKHFLLSYPSNTNTETETTKLNVDQFLEQLQGARKRNAHEKANKASTKTTDVS